MTAIGSYCRSPLVVVGVDHVSHGVLLENFEIAGVMTDYCLAAPVEPDSYPTLVPLYHGPFSQPAPMKNFTLVPLRKAVLEARWGRHASRALVHDRWFGGECVRQ